MTYWQRIPPALAVLCGLLLAGCGDALVETEEAMSLAGECERPDAQACDQLATLYLDGSAYSADYSLGWMFYNYACKEERAPFVCGFYRLGYEFDRRMHGDPGKASVYFLRACELGSAQSCYDYGTIFYSGYGVVKDEDIGMQFMRRGCELGWEQACSTVSELSVEQSQLLAQEPIKN